MIETQNNLSTLEQAKSMVSVGIKDKLTSSPKAIRALTSHLSKSQGKNIRAFSLLTIASDNNGYVRQEAINAAIAIELLHLATLVHDDIIDNAPKRRNIATLNKLFDNKSAVLCGDYLLSIALGLAFEISPARFNRSDEISKTLANSLSEICLGELLQDENRYNFELSESEYFNIIKGKTASLFQIAYLIGFIISDESEDFSDIYSKIGILTGLMFQLADDCLDYESSESKTKKPVLSDYAQGVITLPLIYAMKNSKQLKKSISTIDESTAIEPIELQSQIIELGGIEYTKKKIKDLYNESISLIEMLNISEKKKERLITLSKVSAGYLIN